MNTNEISKTRITVQNVCKSYLSMVNRIKICVLKDSKLQILLGHRTALARNNGSGKTTFLNLICGLNISSAYILTLNPNFLYILFSRQTPIN